MSFAHLNAEVSPLLSQSRPPRKVHGEAVGFASRAGCSLQKRAELQQPCTPRPRGCEAGGDTQQGSILPWGSVTTRHYGQKLRAKRWALRLSGLRASKALGELAGN